jgi:flagellar hook-associated protein 1 FlgK
MSSTFALMSVATCGLYANQTGLNTTGHNVSNANTEGYSRQQIIQSDLSYLTEGRYQYGTGVGIEEVRQIRSVFQDNLYRNENSSLYYWQTRYNTAEDIQTIISDLPVDESMQDMIDEFFGAWSELSKDPASGEERASLLSYANNMVEMFNQLSDQLEQMQKDLDTQIISMVDEINSIAKQTAALNGKIAQCQANNDNANDYKDELNSLLDSLSSYANISVTTDSNGMYRVFIGGVSLVNGTDYNTLTCVTNKSNGSFSTVCWEEDGTQLKLKSGMLLGLIESRGDVDGSTGSIDNGSPVESGTEEADVDTDSESYNFTGSSNNMIAELRSGLNMLVSLLTRKINANHSSGEGLDGSTGVDFFVKIDDSLPFEAGNIMVNPELDDTDKIAASSIGGANDGAIASEIADFIDTDYFSYDGTLTNIDDFCSKLVEWIGTEGQISENYTANQETLVQQLESNRQSISGVSIDEELTKLIQYQQAYNASARLLNIVDGMLETIIKEMGLVGR